jgi:hypothetical protein
MNKGVRTENEHGVIEAGKSRACQVPFISRGLFDSATADVRNGLFVLCERDLDTLSLLYVHGRHHPVRSMAFHYYVSTSSGAKSP